MSQVKQDSERESIGKALGRIPSGLFILTARHEDRAGGMLASWVQQVCFEPAMVVVAIRKGRPIMPLISESRKFGLCQIGTEDKTLMRKFAAGSEEGEDPFLGMDLVDTNSARVPLLKQALAYMECEVACHMDVEGDHDLFVGKILRGAYQGGEPRVHLRENGFSY